MAVPAIKETRTYLTFTLEEEDFAVDVTNVREVLDFTNVTRVPRTPDFMKGVINLRGSVVPVVDMRLKFGLQEADVTVDTCIIVMEVEMEGEATVIGALADSVKEVFELDPGRIEPPPRIGSGLESEFISGMGKYNDSFIIILDVNKVFSEDELIYLKEASDGPTIEIPDPVKATEIDESKENEVQSEVENEEINQPKKAALEKTARTKKRR